MNISDITTPADLVEQNTLTNYEAAAKAVMELTYGECRELMSVMLEAALDFHKAEAVKAHEEGNAKKLVAFTLDIARLQDAVTILSKVS